jgi:hypothetical protein
MREVFDPVRQLWVAATPEEVVRQTWIQRMVTVLGFPKELMAVEKELKVLPHLIEEKNVVPSRRIDVLSFMKTNENMMPLILIECKKGELTQKALDQVASYNYYVKAPYIAIVNQFHIRLRIKEREISTLPSYLELLEGCRG